MHIFQIFNGLLCTLLTPKDQCSAVQFSAVEDSAVQCSAVQWKTVKCSTDYFS